MIAKATRGASFGGLLAYLTRGDRATWTFTRNLVGLDPELVPAVMRATASHSDKIEKPVYHLVLSAAPEDRLNAGQWNQIASRVLEEIGLGDHQALFVRHGDGATDHLHVMVNRVAQDGTVWNGYREYPRIRQALRELERELGLRELGERSRDSPTADHHRTPAERQQARHGDQPPWADQVVQTLRQQFRDSTTWADLVGRVEAAGYRLERRGRGLVVTDGQLSIKASRVDRKGSRGKLEARFGENFRAWEARRQRLDREFATYDGELARRQRLTQIQDRVPPAESHRHHRLEQSQHQVDRRLAASEDRLHHYRRELGEAAFRLLVPPRLAKPLSYALRFRDLMDAASRYEDLTRRHRVVQRRLTQAWNRDDAFREGVMRKHQLDAEQKWEVSCLSSLLRSSNTHPFRQRREEFLQLAHKPDKERRRALRKAYPLTQWPTKEEYARFGKALEDLVKSDQALAEYGPAWEARRQEHRDRIAHLGQLVRTLEHGHLKPLEKRIQRAVGSYGLQLAKRFLSHEAAKGLDQSLAHRRRRLKGAIRRTTRELAQLDRLKRELGYSPASLRAERLRQRRRRLVKHLAALERRHLAPARYRLAVTAAKALVPPKLRLALQLAERVHRIHRSLSRDRGGREW